MTRISSEKHIGISAALVPVLAVLFWAVPWPGDPRTLPVVERFFRLKNSPWSWDQAEYQRMLDTIDVNQVVDGKPLFVTLAIDAKDEVMLQRMMKRGANVNASDWGCTPLLAAIEADIAIEKDRTHNTASLTLLVLRAGADPNLRPDAKGVSKRLSTGIPKDSCTTLDDSLKYDSSPLRIAIEKVRNDEVLGLLLKAGAVPAYQEDAQAILLTAVKRMEGDTLDKLLSLTTGHGASIEAAFDGGFSFDSSTDTALASVIDRRGNAKDVERMLKHGADPNRRTKKGELPLQLAIDRCPNLWSPYQEQWFDGPLSAYNVEEWRSGDKKGIESNREGAARITTLLIGGANPNLPLKEDGSGGSLLTYAVKRCPSDIPKILVAYKAQINSAAINAARYDLKHFLLNHGQSQ